MVHIRVAVIHVDLAHGRRRGPVQTQTCPVERQVDARAAAGERVSVGETDRGRPDAPRMCILDTGGVRLCFITSSLSGFYAADREVLQNLVPHDQGLYLEPEAQHNRRRH